MGLRWISVESWLYAIAEGARRGRLVGIHETVIHAAQAAGPALLALLGVLSPAGFHAGAGFALLAGACLLAAPARAPRSATRESTAPWAVLAGLARDARHRLGIQLGLLSGLVDGVLFGMLAVYLVKRGFSASQAALAMTVFGIGGLVLQMPLGWLSDRRGVISATRASALLGVAGALLLLPGDASLAWLAAGLLGAASGGALTVAIIAGTEGAVRDGHDMAVAVTQVSLAFTLGSTVGPALTGALMDAVGPAALPVLGLLACAALMLPGRARRS